MTIIPPAPKTEEELKAEREAHKAEMEAKKAEHEAKKAEAYRELNKIFMEDQPSIPLVYLPEQFYEFSDRVWTNWPTEKNPYAPAQLPWVASGTKTLWNLKLAK